MYIHTDILVVFVKQSTSRDVCPASVCVGKGDGELTTHATQRLLVLTVQLRTLVQAILEVFNFIEEILQQASHVKARTSAYSIMRASFSNCQTHLELCSFIAQLISLPAPCETYWWASRDKLIFYVIWNIFKLLVIEVTALSIGRRWSDTLRYTISSFKELKALEIPHVA